MEAPTEEQIRRLNDLITHLDRFPLPELLQTAGSLIIQAPLSDHGKVVHREYLAGAFAVHKIGFYTQALKSFDRERLSLGQHAHHQMEIAKELLSSDPAAAATAYGESVMLSSYQEVTFHFWSICVTRISRLMKVAARHTGYKLPEEDRDLLESYRPLRDYFEHLEDEVPGKMGRTDIVREVEGENEWRVIVGFESDELGRIVLNGKIIDVTTEGLDHVVEVVDRSFDGFRAGILARTRKFFLDHLKQIPSPVQVPCAPLVSVAFE